MRIRHDEISSDTPYRSRKLPAQTLMILSPNGLKSRNAPPATAQIERINVENPAPSRDMAPAKANSWMPPKRISTIPISVTMKPATQTGLRNNRMPSIKSTTAFTAINGSTPSLLLRMKP